MASEKQKRSRRGGVSVTVRGGILRLRWRYEGKRYQLSLCIPDTPENRQIAAQKAAQIEADILAGEYDPSLNTYRIIAAPPMAESTGSTVELFEQFTEFKRLDGISGQTLSTKYRALRANLARFGRDVLTTDDARAVVDLLRGRQSPQISNQNLVLLKSFGAWLAEQRLLQTNVFEPIRPLKGARAIKVQDRTPFTRGELALFLETMRSHPTASHYYDFTVVLFSLGLRPSEAIGLRWGHINLTRKTVTIRESLSRSSDGLTSGRSRERKGTKTDNVRVLPLNDQLVDLFIERWHLGVAVDELIFTAANGGPIDDHNYRERYWKVVCEAAGIRYRPPYTSRHTLISYGLEYEGWTYKQAAAVAGHTTTRMIEETYGHLMNMPSMPDMEL
jgi:integrase